jgi:hypothetical protein
LGVARLSFFGHILIRNADGVTTHQKHKQRIKKAAAEFREEELTKSGPPSLGLRKLQKQ